MKTQCPYCKRDYDIDDAKIPVAKAAIRCTQCQKVFDYIRGQGAVSKQRTEQTKPAPSTQDTSPSNEDSSQKPGFWTPGTISDLPPRDDASSESDEIPDFSDDSFAALDEPETEPSIQAEFGSADDYAGGLAGDDEPSSPIEQSSEPAPHNANSSLEELLGPRSAPPTQNEKVLDADTSQEKVAKPLPPGFEEDESQDDLISSGGAAGYWDQMQSLGEEEQTVGEESEIELSEPAPIEDAVSDEELLASLDLEKRKVQTETNELDLSVTETLEDIKETEKAPSSGTPSASPAQHEPAMQVTGNMPDEVLNSQSQSTPPQTGTPIAKTPLKQVSVKPHEGIDQDTIDILPVTRAERGQKQAAKSAPPPRQVTNPGLPSQQPIPSVKKSAPGWNGTKIVMSVTLLAVVGVLLSIAIPKVLKTSDDEVEFESSAIKTLVERHKDAQGKVEKVETMGSKKLLVKKDKKKKEVIDDRPAFEKGIDAYNQHNIEGYKRAETELRKAYEEEEASERSTIALAKLFAVLGKEFDRKDLLKKAFSMTQTLLKDNPKSADALVAQAMTYYYSNDFKKAFATSQKALAHKPDHNEGFLVRGMAMWKLGKGGGGLQQAQKADPKAYMPLQQLCLYYLDTEKYKSALSIGKKMAKLFPNRPEGYQHMMVSAWKMKKFSSAEKYAKKAMGLEGNGLYLYKQIAEMHLDQGKPEKAADVLELFLAEKERLPREELAEVYLILGKAYMKRDPSRAVFYFKKLVGWDENDVTAINYLGLAYFEAEEYKASISRFRDAAKISPHNSQILFNLGLAYLKAGMLKNAEKMFRLVLSKDQKNVDSTFYLASVQEQKGERMEAIKSLENVLRLDPNHNIAKAKLKKLKSGL